MFTLLHDKTVTPQMALLAPPCAKGLDLVLKESRGGWKRCTNERWVLAGNNAFRARKFRQAKNGGGQKKYSRNENVTLAIVVGIPPLFLSREGGGKL